MIIIYVHYLHFFNVQLSATDSLLFSTSLRAFFQNFEFRAVDQVLGESSIGD